jgi:hypothetical protein
MRCGAILVLLALFVSPATGQKASQPPPTEQPPPIEHTQPVVTFEDCVARCEKCKRLKDPDCIKNSCTGYPHRKPGESPLPVVCPQTY